MVGASRALTFQRIVGKKVEKIVEKTLHVCGSVIDQYGRMAFRSNRMF